MSTERPTEATANQARSQRAPSDEEGEPQNRPRPRDFTCFNCGRQGHKAKSELCKAKDANCRHCGKRGHFAVVCRSRSQRTPEKAASGHRLQHQAIDKKPATRSNAKPAARFLETSAEEPPPSPTSSEDFSIFSVSNCASDNCDCLPITLNDVLVKCIPDTGASVNVIPRKMCVWDFEPCDRSLRVFGGEKLNVAGSVSIDVAYADKCYG